MKSKIVSSLFLSLFCFLAVSLNASNSQAIIGAVTGNVALMAAGGATWLGGGVGMIVGFENFSDFGAFAGGFAEIAGFVLLSDHESVSPQFTSLGEPQAESLKLTSAELNAYNAEIDWCERCVSKRDSRPRNVQCSESSRLISRASRRGR